ncbi:spore germination protein GerPE [Cohnella panacarvi]|uniref:spore germination protein GerPE n=1 Tax=Cohnella panacarvi TaxID=400776 RepID=UPI00047D60E7|nr:spore germination protein GerPE [Cohnella panacarvi]
MPKGQRTTRIVSIALNTVGSSSVAQFGDNNATNLKSRAIAVQRAVANNDEGDDVRFASYGLFTRPLLQLHTGITVGTRIDRPSPDIEIGCIDVTALSSSALLRAGCGGPLTAQTRVLHIRHFNNPGIR